MVVVVGCDDDAVGGSLAVLVVVAGSVTVALESLF